MKRFMACEIEEMPLEWIWPSVRSVETWKAKAPQGMSKRDKAKWAKEQQAILVKAEIDILQDRLRSGAQLDVQLDNGELRIHDQGITVLDGIYVDAKYARQILISWRNFLRLNPVSDTLDAVALAEHLRNVRKTDNAAMAEQIENLDAELIRIEKEIATAETNLNRLANALYGLTADEIETISN